MSSFVNNKRIAINTLYLYIRMLLIMFVSLYTVRVVLDSLGAEDYGLYNVVGSVVAMLAFLRGTMASASNRFFSVEMVSNDIEKLRRTFSININIYVFITAVILAVAETAGVWYISNKLNCSPERWFAVQVIFQLSLLSFIAQLMAVTYNALIMSHERMNVYAILSILETMIKLGVAYAIKHTTSDKLILYASLMALTDIFLWLFYWGYCRLHFEECRYTFVWDKSKYKEILSFTGWNFLGQIAVVLRAQGINLLINAFFNPAVNAARAIAYQVESTSIRFSENFFSAVRPQLYKAYSNNEMQPLFKLIDRSTIMCTYLMSIIMLPLILNGGFVLSVWLKEVPAHTELFMALALINGFIDCMSNGVIVSAAATGRIKKFQLVVSGLIALNLPISYFVLRIGCSPESTVVVSIIIAVLLVFVRMTLLKQNIPTFNQNAHLIIVVRIMVFTLIAGGIGYILRLIIDSSILYLLCSSIVAILTISIFYYAFIIGKEDRMVLMSLITSKLKSKIKK